MTDHERALVSRAADSLLAAQDTSVFDPFVPSAEAIFNAHAIPWRRQVTLMVATLELARERGMPTTDERHRAAGIANARVRWGRLAGRAS